MQSRRLRVAVIYGGRSGEHEVSIESARSVLAAIDPTRYEALPIAITHEGAWHAVDPQSLLQSGVAERARLLPSADPQRPWLVPVGDPLAPTREPLDVAFPLVHGTYGEDGCLPGLLELAGVPYVGSGVLGSAVGMDKIVMKRAFMGQGLPIVPHLQILRSEWERQPGQVIARVVNAVGVPCFVKPANLGSSVGITRVVDPAALPPAINCAAQFSPRILAERAVSAREFECAVLGNDDPVASVVGEVLIARDFYDYEAKYRDSRTNFAVPAEISQPTADRIRELALGAFRAIGAAGMARVDFFLDRDDDGALYLNEINTIPGFTTMSAYPRLWEASGVPYPQLIDRLISLALERHADQARNRTHYE